MRPRAGDGRTESKLERSGGRGGGLERMAKQSGLRFVARDHDLAAPMFVPGARAAKDDRRHLGGHIKDG